MFSRFFYDLLLKLVGICFNILNLILAGNLPPLGSAGVIIEEQGKYLVVERSDGRYVFPSGFIRWRERATETAVRECLEETGLQVRVTRLIGCSSHTSEGFTKLSSIVVMYQGEVTGGELRHSIEGRPHWLEASELLPHLHPQQKGIFEDFLRHDPGVKKSP